MASNNYIYKMSNAGGMATVTRYTDMLAGNAVWNPYEPVGNYDSIATVTVPSGGLASITFAGIPAGYRDLQIRMSARNTFAGSGGGISALLEFNADTSGSYTFHRLIGDGASATAGAATGLAYTQVGYMSRNGDTSNFSTSVIDILDYASTTKNTTLRTLSGADYNGSGFAQLWSGLYTKTDAISSIKIYSDGGASWTEFSQFSLYGVR